jgi:nucleotide-binding universal stress UspA family protein
MREDSLCAICPKQFRLSFSDLLVAYDSSKAAASALKYGCMLSKHFGGVIHLISVQSGAAYACEIATGAHAMRVLQADLQSELNDVKRRLRQQGILSDVSRRVGNASDAIQRAVTEYSPNLLLLGAYGHGAIDRRHLGSTAEHLLQTVRCPTLVVGPEALLRDQEAPQIRRILCPMSSFDADEHVPAFAGQLAIAFGAELEFLHVADGTEKSGVANFGFHRRRLDWCEQLQSRGVFAHSTVIHGMPEWQIGRRASALQASLVLFGLHRTGGHMIDCSDGVVSSTIRQAGCPVMIVPASDPL